MGLYGLHCSDSDQSIAGALFIRPTQINPLPPIKAPGRPLWGLFCVTPLLDPRHFKVERVFDPRSVSILALVGTFLASAVLYTLALRALGREQARLLEEEVVASGCVCEKPLMRD